MWGRITNLAERIDDNFGASPRNNTNDNDDGDDNDDDLYDDADGDGWADEEDDLADFDLDTPSAAPSSEEGDVGDADGIPEGDKDDVGGGDDGEGANIAAGAFTFESSFAPPSTHSTVVPSTPMMPATPAPPPPLDEFHTARRPAFHTAKADEFHTARADYGAGAANPAALGDEEKEEVTSSLSALFESQAVVAGGEGEVGHMGGDGYGDEGVMEKDSMDDLLDDIEDDVPPQQPPQPEGEETNLAMTSKALHMGSMDDGAPSSMEQPQHLQSADAAPLLGYLTADADNEAEDDYLANQDEEDDADTIDGLLDDLDEQELDEEAEYQKYEQGLAAALDEPKKEDLDEPEMDEEEEYQKYEEGLAAALDEPEKEDLDEPEFDEEEEYQNYEQGLAAALEHEEASILANGEGNCNEIHTNALPPSVVTVSAPGKVLVAGGYLVLESPNPGVVLAAENCRFHSTVAFRPANHEGGGADDVETNGEDLRDVDDWSTVPLDVHSPQFGIVYRYRLSYHRSSSSSSEEKAVLRLEPRAMKEKSTNVFVERTVLLALGYVREALGAEGFHARLAERTMVAEEDRREEHEKDVVATDGTMANGFAAGTNGHSSQPQQQQEEEVALAIQLRADNAFYSQVSHLQSQNMDMTPANASKLEPFLPCETSNGDKANKTGMGSSAALVTSLVGALLRFFGVVAALPKEEGGRDADGEEVVTKNGKGGETEEGLRITHNLSQICHCHAQGKVGSGFDVSSAVFGSHVYARFSKEVIAALLEDLEQGVVVALAMEEGRDDGADDKTNGGGLQLSGSLTQRLQNTVDDPSQKWDCSVTPLHLPPGLEILMADVNSGGSESPSMARRILAWKKSDRRTGFLDDYYWRNLKRCNQRIANLLSNDLQKSTICDGLRRDGAMILANRTAAQWRKPMPSSWHEYEGSSWDVAARLLDLRQAFVEARQNLRGMGEAAGVEVEPVEQKELADATMRLPGWWRRGYRERGGGMRCLWCM